MSWELVRLGEVCQITSGGTPSRKNKEYYESADIPWIKTGDLKSQYITNPQEYISHLGLKDSSAKVFPPKTVLVALYGATIGNCSILNIEAATNQACGAILPSKHLVPEYLYHYLCLYKPIFISQGVGGAQPNISGAILKSTPIPLPPLETQNRIVELLDRAQALIDKRKEQIGLMDQLIQSLFHDMFGDPVTNPMGWPSQELGSISEIKSGVTKGRKLEGKETIKIPYMRVANVQDGHLNLEDIAEIEVLPKDVTTYKLQKNDLLLTEGGDPDKLGRGAIWKGEVKYCIHQNHIFRVRLFPHIMIPEYASRLIGSQRGKRYFLKSAKQTTGIASINMTQLKKCSMLLPPIDLQNTFAERVQEIETQKESMTASLHEMEDNFNSLMQRAFKGAN